MKKKYVLAVVVLLILGLHYSYFVRKALLQLHGVICFADVIVLSGSMRPFFVTLPAIAVWNLLLIYGDSKPERVVHEKDRNTIWIKCVKQTAVNAILGTAMIIGTSAVMNRRYLTRPINWDSMDSYFYLCSASSADQRYCLDTSLSLVVLLTSVSLFLILWITGLISIILWMVVKNVSIPIIIFIISLGLERLFGGRIGLISWMHLGMSAYQSYLYVMLKGVYTCIVISLVLGLGFRCFQEKDFL